MIAAATLSDFGNNIGVDQIIHRLTFLPKSSAAKVDTFKRRRRQEAFNPCA
jgi:hypothetical protein